MVAKNSSDTGVCMGEFSGKQGQASKMSINRKLRFVNFFLLLAG